MKNITAYFSLLVFMQTFTLCIPDPCEGVVCQNGGTCSSGVCICPAGFSGTHCETPDDQIWKLTFSDGGSAPHVQVVFVLVKGFTNSGTFSELASSGGLWMFDVNGERCFRLPVGGNIVRDSPGDRWSFVSMSGGGCGMSTLGTNASSGVANGNFPLATYVGNGVVTLTTQSTSFGTASGDAYWYAERQ